MSNLRSWGTSLFQQAKRWRRSIYLGAIVFGAGLFAWQVVLAIDAMRNLPTTRVNSSTLLAAIAGFVVCYVLQLLAWLTLMRSVGVSIPLTGGFQGYYLSFLPRYIPGSIWGYFGRGEWLARGYGVPYRISNIGSALEALFFLFSAATWITVAQLGIGWASSGVFLVIVICWIVVWVQSYRLVMPDPQIRFRYSLTTLIIAFILYWVYWLAQGIAISLQASGVGITDPSLSVLALTGTAALAWSIGFLTIFVPSGLGVREASFAFLLNYQLSLSLQDSALLAVLSRGGLILAELIVLVTTMTLRVLIKAKSRDLEER